MRRARVTAARVVTWCANFETSHGATSYAVESGALSLLAADGSTARLRAPFDREATGTGVEGLVALCDPPPEWGVLLVRKGGFALARLHGATVVGRKVGQRHVQGRTKAGGQSQQRFARRRDNQARAAYAAAAGHAVRLLADPPVQVLVTGGDRAAVEAVLSDPAASVLAPAVTGDWLVVPDPRGTVLDAAIADACSATIEVHNA